MLMSPTTYANEPRNGVFSNRIVEWILGISTMKDDGQKYQKIANLVFFQRSKTHVLGGFEAVYWILSNSLYSRDLLGRFIELSTSIHKLWSN